MQSADLWGVGGSAGVAIHAGGLRQAGGGARPAASQGSRPGGRAVHFDVSEERPGAWGWSLRDAYGEEVAHSHAAYPSRVQASAAALAFSQMVAQAGRQARER